MSCTIKKENKFLYLPRKIYGKWYWLKTITEVTTTKTCVVNGNVQNIVIKKEYYL